MTSPATIKLLDAARILPTYSEVRRKVVGPMTRQFPEPRVGHQLTPLQKQYVLRAESNLFLSEQPNQRLEPILEYQGVNYRKMVGDPDGNHLRKLYLRRVWIEDYSELFEFDDELGEPAFIMIVRDVDTLTAIDFVAWPIRRPDIFGTYFEYAGLLGGDAVINPSSFIEAPCPIWGTPLAWLQSGLRGCVVLNPRLAAPILAQAPGFFQCEDEDHARWLVDEGAVVMNKLMVPARRTDS
jgi:hypothetical protein